MLVCPRQLFDLKVVEKLQVVAKVNVGTQLATAASRQHGSLRELTHVKWTVVGHAPGFPRRAVNLNNPRSKFCNPSQAQTSLPEFHELLCTSLCRCRFDRCRIGDWRNHGQDNATRRVGEILELRLLTTPLSNPNRRFFSGPPCVIRLPLPGRTFGRTNIPGARGVDSVDVCEYEAGRISGTA